MKIVQPSVILVHHTHDPLRVIEKMGRICYQSSHKTKVCSSCGGGGSITHDEGSGSDLRIVCEPCSTCDGSGTDISSAITFIKMIMERGHESVIEHASAGFLIVTDRGVTHEIVRHRLASYSQESTRYCDYGADRFGGELSFILPPGLSDTEEDPFSGAPMVGSGELWRAQCLDAESRYKQMRCYGLAPEIARSVLPNALKSEIGMTANFREWRHFLRLRTSPKVHPQMRQIADMIRTELMKIAAPCFEDIT